MIRFSTIFFCMLLAAAAIGRYRAEASVKAERVKLERIESKIDVERRKISQLELEVEVLESPKRLVQLGASNGTLMPTQPHQVLSAEKFAALMGEPLTDQDPADDTLILDAIAMADFGSVVQQ